MPLPHILIIPPWFDIEFQHHFGKSYHRWASDLADMDQGRVGLLYGEFHKGFRLKRYFDKNDLNYYYLGISDWGLPKAGWGWLLWEKQYIKVFEEYVRRYGLPTVIHGFSLLGVIAAGMIHKRHNIPFVYTEVLGSFINGTVTRRLVRKAKRYVEQASLVCGISPGMVSSLVKTFNTSAKNIPLYVDGGTFYPKNQQGGTPSFTIIGSPAQTKGMDILIKAMSIVVKKLPEAKLTIVDELPERLWLESLIKSHHVEKHILFTGAVPYAKIPDLIWQSHVLVSSSRIESLGYTMIESLSCGRPVVATKTPGSSYIVEKNMGSIVPQENPAELANAMVEVYQNIHQYDPFELHKTVQSRFNKKKILGEWMGIYQDLSFEKSAP